VKDIKVGVEKMTRNRRKMIKQSGDSLLLSKHSIQLSALFLLLSGFSLIKAILTMIDLRLSVPCATGSKCLPLPGIQGQCSSNCAMQICLGSPVKVYCKSD
jgi:hypothetical protein